MNNSLTCTHVLVPWIESVASKNAHGHGDIASNTIGKMQERLYHTEVVRVLFRHNTFTQPFERLCMHRVMNT